MRYFVSAFLCIAAAFGVLANPSYAAATATAKPGLVVVVVVDQLSSELFDRLAPLFTGGFKTFRDRGVQFSNAQHDHAFTQTAPGHFVIMSGLHPGRGGIIANEFYDRTKRKIVYAVDDPDARVFGSDERGVSYRDVDVTALGDWMKSADARSMVYSVAGKDRAAILLGGKHPDCAFWFDNDAGGFTTSTYYRDTVPTLAVQFNAKESARQYFGKKWEHSLKDDRLYQTYAGVDDAAGENAFAGEDSPVFPHALIGPPDVSERDAFGRFRGFPWLDEMTLDFAEHILISAGLGADDHPDLLCVSLSAFDIIGHTFGPNSREAMDAAVCIDRKLAEFQRDVEKRVGRKRVVFVLSSDHGILPLVERLRAAGKDSARVNDQVKAFREKVLNELEKKYGQAESFFMFRGQENMYFDHDALARRKIPPADVYQFVRQLAVSESWIAEVVDRDQLLSGAPVDPIVERTRHSFHPAKGADIYLIPKPYYLTSGAQARGGTNHGTPYTYDSHVPMIFLLPDAGPAVISRPVRTVDLAPTLSRLLGVTPPSDVDGSALPEIISR